MKFLQEIFAMDANKKRGNNSSNIIKESSSIDDSHVQKFKELVKMHFNKAIADEFDDEEISNPDFKNFIDVDGTIDLVGENIRLLSSYFPAKHSVKHIGVEHFTEGESDVELRIVLSAGICEFNYIVYFRPLDFKTSIMFYAVVKDKYISEKYLSKHKVDEFENYPDFHKYDCIFGDGANGLFSEDIPLYDLRVFTTADRDSRQQALKQLSSAKSGFASTLGKLSVLAKAAGEVASYISEWYFDLSSEFEDPKITKLKIGQVPFEVWTLDCGFAGGESTGKTLKA